MGSLMGGWDSPVKDPKVVKYQRNKSYTRGEIEAFWKAKKESEDGSSTESSPRQGLQEETKPLKRYQRSSSMPLPFRGSYSIVEDHKADCESENTVQNSCWWTKSNWAFLNEQPIMEMEEQPLHRRRNCGTSTETINKSGIRHQIGS